MKVIIIGAGIGGLAAAIGLRQAGIDVSIYEQRQGLEFEGAGISLWTNAIEALTQLGLEDAMRLRAMPPDRAVLRKPSGALITATPLEKLKGPSGAPAMVVLHRADLIALLREALGAPVHQNHRVIGFEERGGFEEHAGVIQARFENGSEVEGDVLVGADGIHSAICRQLNPTALPRYAGYTAWRAVTRFEAAQKEISETWGCGRRFGVVPMAGGQVYWFATDNCESGQPACGKPQLLELFGKWHSPIPELIEASEETSILRNDIYDRDPLPYWGRGRVTLLGDAAHPMTPNLGQGGCQAIEDALVLARCLALEPDAHAALRSYESRRRSRTRDVVIRSRQIGVLGQLANPWSGAIRDLAVRLSPAALSIRQLRSVISYRGHLG